MIVELLIILERVIIKWWNLIMSFHSFHVVRRSHQCNFGDWPHGIICSRNRGQKSMFREAPPFDWRWARQRLSNLSESLLKTSYFASSPYLLPHCQRCEPFMVLCISEMSTTLVKLLMVLWRMHKIDEGPCSHKSFALSSCSCSCSESSMTL